LKRAGLDCPTVGGAGTGTHEFEAASGVYTELQVGSYVFMDADYGRNLKADGAPVDAFRHSLFIQATIMSHPAPARAYVDAGLKAFSVDSGLPTVCGIEATLERASDEHGNLALAAPVNRSLVGEKIRLIPG